MYIIRTSPAFWRIQTKGIKSFLKFPFLIVLIAANLFNIPFISIGFNLRLTTVTIVIYLFINAARLKRVASFFFREPFFSVLFGTYLLSLFFSIANADVLILSIKQLVLYCMLILNIAFFLSFRVQGECLLRHFTWWFCGFSLLLNIYSCLQPIIALNYVGWGSLLRPTGFFASSNVLGIALTMMTGFSYGILLTQSVNKMLYIIGTILLCTSILLFALTFNRGSIAGFIIQSACVLILFLPKLLKAHQRLLPVFMFLVLLSIGTIYCLQSIVSFHGGISQWEYITNSVSRIGEGGLKRDENWSIRMESSSLALSRFKENMLFGSGLANSIIRNPDKVKRAIKSGNVEFIRQSNEMMYIDVLTETGIFGTLMFILFFGYIIIRAFFTLYSGYAKKEPYFHIVAIGGFLSIVGSLVNGVSSSPLTIHFFWLNIGVVIYLWKCIPSQHKTSAL